MEINLNKQNPIKIVSHPRKNLHCVLFMKKACIILEENEKFDIVFEIHDEDENEIYLAAAFVSCEKDEFLVLAGYSGIIKGFDLERLEYSFFLRGHGGSINEICVHSIYHNIIFTASHDLSIRMWDINKRKNISIYGGIAGHRDIILSCDISLCGKYLVSSSNDTTIKIWKVKIPNDDMIIAESFPIFSTTKIQRDYISCVRFYGRFVVCNDKQNSIIVFCPSYNVVIYSHNSESDFFFIKDFNFEKSKNLNKKFIIYNDTLVVASNDVNSQFHSTCLKQLNVLHKDIKNFMIKINDMITSISVKNKLLYILTKGGIVKRVQIQQIFGS